MFKDFLYNAKHTFLLVFKIYAPIVLLFHVMENWHKFSVIHIVIYSALVAALFVIVFYDFIKPIWKSSAKHRQSLENSI